jgi:hypothetical protein
MYKCNPIREGRGMFKVVGNGKSRGGIGAAVGVTLGAFKFHRRFGADRVPRRMIFLLREMVTALEVKVAVQP